MAVLDESASNRNFWLAACWIIGVIVAIIVTEADESLKFVSDDVLKWIGQVLVPICLLTLSRVFGLTLTRQFGALLSRKKVYWLTLSISVVFILFAIGSLFAAANANPGAFDKPEYKLRQLQILSNSGTTILIAMIWPILSILLDYLFPKSDSSAAASGTPLSASSSSPTAEEGP